MNCRSGLRAGFYPSRATPTKLGERQYRVAGLRDVPSARWMPSLQPPHKLTASRRSPLDVSDFPLLKAILNPWTDPATKGPIFGVCSPAGETRLEVLTCGKAPKAEYPEAHRRPATVRRLLGGLELGWETGIEPATVGATVRCSAS